VRRYSGQFVGNEFGGGSGPIWLDNVQCNATERNIGDCQHSGWGSNSCTHDNDVSISCDVGIVKGIQIPYLNSPTPITLLTRKVT